MEYQSELTGQHVGHYVVGERLGAGGFGEVWAARHDAIARDVAIKVLHEKYSRDATATARFVAEAKAANTIDHPNIVQVFDFGTLPDGRSYIVMERLRGKTLKQLLVERGSLPLTEAMPIFRGIARAIDAAHAAGLAHRDLKPDNVFVLANGGVKVIDFGLVKLVGDRDALTETGVISGTPLYMSPEQFRGKDVGLATDAYSFGALAYHVLLGKPPFVAPDAIALGLRHLNDAPPSDAPPWILALLDKDPDVRPRSLVAALGDDIGTSSTIMRVSVVQQRPARKWIALAPVALIAIAAGAWWLHHETPAAVDPTPRIQIRAWPTQIAAVERAAPRMMRQALRNAPGRTYWLAADDAAGDVTLDLAIELRGDAVSLAVWRGPAVIAAASAPSVREALASVVPTVATLLSAGRTATPDEEDVVGMKSVHAPSLDAYRRYHAITDRYDQSAWVSTDATIAQLEQLIADEPRWSRPYAIICLAKGRSKEGCAKELAAEAAHADPTLDPTGHAVLSSVRNGRDQDLGELEKYPDMRLDPELAISLSQAYGGASRPDDALAITNQLYLSRPDLQFGSQLVDTLHLMGRAKESEALAARWAETSPESLQALTTWARVLARRGDLAGGKAALRLRRVLLGEDHDAWVELCDVYLALGDLAMAHHFVDRLLVDAALTRAFGRHRAGIIAVLEGRFTVAYDTLHRAYAENAPFGSMSQTTQVLALLVSLAPLVGQPGDLRAELVKLRDTFGFAPTVQQSVAYELALVDRKPGAACPAIAPFIDVTAPNIDHAVLRRRDLRIAARYGCATCAEAVAAGLSEAEPDTRSLVTFGRCAEQTHQLGLARDAYERAKVTASSNEASTFESVVATAHLADVLRQLGDREAARRNAAYVVERWGNADRAVPEVELARRVLLDVK